MRGAHVVASRVLVQPACFWGGRKRRCASGAAANGIPLQTLVLFATNPRTGPKSVFTSTAKATARDDSKAVKSIVIGEAASWPHQDHGPRYIIKRVALVMVQRGVKTPHGLKSHGCTAAPAHHKLVVSPDREPQRASIPDEMEQQRNKSARISSLSTVGRESRCWYCETSSHQGVCCETQEEVEYHTKRAQGRASPLFQPCRQP